MSNNTQLPDEMVEEVKKKAEAKTAIENERIIGDSKDYGRRISYLDGYEAGCIELATEYATKLHIEQQAHEETRKSFKKQLNNRLHQAQQEIESLTNQLKGHATVSNENMKLLRQENESARTLLQKFISRHEAGLLPDRFIYDEIKQFLDGK